MVFGRGRYQPWSTAYQKVVLHKLDPPAYEDTHSENVLLSVSRRFEHYKFMTIASKEITKLIHLQVKDGIFVLPFQDEQGKKVTAPFAFAHEIH